MTQLGPEQGKEQAPEPVEIEYAQGYNEGVDWWSDCFPQWKGQ